MRKQSINARCRRVATAATLILASALAGRSAVSGSAPPSIPISQVPLTVAIPAHPQVLFALANSQSMDGDLSGAIMTGSGGLGNSLGGLVGTTAQPGPSPLLYTVPSGFTAPETNTAAGSLAPYTTTASGVEYDNSASRLNVAKAGIISILQSFLPVADFGLIDYQTSGISNDYCGGTTCTTWVYYMSPSGTGFQFTNTAPTSGEYVDNPCYGVSLDTASTLDNDCYNLNQRYPGINTYTYMLVSASSDDPSVNDVFYAGPGAIEPVCVVYNGPHPASPYPPYQSLSSYETGNVYESYYADVGSCATATGPTNAGYVPYSQEVMYAERGFGFLTTGETSKPSSSTSWPPLIPMTSAGQVPTQTSINAALACFTGGSCSSTSTTVPNYLAPETNQISSSEIKALATQSPIAGLLTAAGDYYSAKDPASSNGCDATRYVVLVTDGLPTLDLSGHNWPPLGSAAAAGYGVTATFNSDGSLNTTNDQALTDTINELKTLENAGIKTYIIGVGAGVDPSANAQAAATMTAMAVAGGTGSYFAATTAQQLNTDMEAILAKILATTQSTASTAVNTTGLNNGSVAYLAQFVTSDTYQDWTGNLSAYPIDATTGQVNTSSGSQIWSAQAKIDAQNWDTGRLIATWDPVANAGTPFRWNSNLAPDGISSSTTLGMDLSSFTGDTNGQDVLNFLRGDDSKEQRNGGAFRNRTHKLGDIVSSAPLYVAAPQGFSQSTSYFSFVNAHKNRAPILYIGANDGMLHAIDATTGKERFAYIPNGVFANLVNLANPYYNEQHLFYVNGSPEAADVQFSDDSWHTVLVGNEAAGGKSLFALDISSADTITTEAQLASIALWEFTDSDMGYSFSEPAFAYTSAGWLVFAGNGYDSPSEKPVLYALNPQTGAIVEKIDLCAAVASICNASESNGLSSVTVINSFGEAAAPADTVYAGDLQGNVWRVDISNSNPADWVVTVIYQARDGSGNPQPITTAPAVTLNPYYPRLLGTMVYVGTGQLLSLNDLATTQVQTLYGLFDPPRGSATPLGFSGIPTRTNLVQQTMSSATISGVSVRVESSVNPVNIPTDRGWYLDFNLDAGERIVTNPQIEAGGAVVVTSYQPNTSSCTGGGNAWLGVFNYATGGSFALPELDIQNTGTLTNKDQTSTGLNPVGLALGSVYASTPTIVPTGCMGANCTGGKKLINLSNVQVKTVGDAGGAKLRRGWWEVRH